MMDITPEKFLKVMEKNNHRVFYGNTKPYNLNIIGFRWSGSRPNYFDDTIGVYYQNHGDWFYKVFEATTLPGTPHLLKPINFRGAAILVPGQYELAYQIGLHKGKYKALVQVEPLDVYRDNNKDNVYDVDALTAQRGLFGINIHKASLFATVVGTNSAGCQVIRKSDDFEAFMGLCEKSRRVWGNKFSYTLVNI